MRHKIILSICLGSTLLIAACEKGVDQAEVDRAIKDVNVIDETNLSDIMLTSANPQEAINFFSKSAADNPDRIDLRRGLAKSLVRAKKPTQAVPHWDAVTKMDGATHEDSVDYADALIRANNWAEAELALNSIPPTYETYRRYRLEAMIADSQQKWSKADSFYQTAAGLTTRPASVMNNWGYSKLTRGEYKEAERLFAEALVHDQSLFTAKNNLVLARGAQRKYDLPVVPMTQIEQAQLMHTMALTAIKQGDVTIGRGLLNEAVETHPQHFPAAARALEALDANVQN